MNEESSDAFNRNDDDSDLDDVDDSKRKKSSKRGRGKKNNADALIDDKPFVCDQCGAKYKTRPGLSYHVQKTHNLRLSINPSGASPMTIAAKLGADLIHADENTNSLFESVYDENSSSLSQSNNTGTATAASLNQLKSKCGVCAGSEHESRVSQNEKFVACFECNKVFHPSCLNFTANMLLSAKGYNWLCIECKRCTVCGNSENDDKLLFCDDCDRGYHMYCLNPPLTEAPDGDWRCQLCVKKFGVQ